MSPRTATAGCDPPVRSGSASPAKDSFCGQMEWTDATKSASVYNPEQDCQRFHVLSDGGVVVSPDHISSFFNRVVINEVQHASSTPNPGGRVHI